MLFNYLTTDQEKDEFFTVVYYALINTVNEYEEKKTIREFAEQLFYDLNYSYENNGTYDAIDDKAESIDVMIEQVDDLFDDYDEELFIRLCDKKILEDFFKVFENADQNKKKAIVLDLLISLIKDQQIVESHNRILELIYQTFSIDEDFIKEAIVKVQKFNLARTELKSILPNKITVLGD